MQQFEELSTLSDTSPQELTERMSNLVVNISDLIKKEPTEFQEFFDDDYPEFSSIIQNLRYEFHKLP